MRELSSVIAAFVVAAAAAPGAAASAPVPVPGWTQEQGSVAVDGAGRGLAAFGHGEHAWAVSVAPDGTLSGLGRIAAPRTEGGPAYVTAALSERGDAVVEYSSSGGSAPGPDGYGFVFRPWLARFGWGTAPGAAQLASTRAKVRVDEAFPVVRPDGTVLLSYTANDIAGGRDGASLALARPGARVTSGPAVRALRHAQALSLTGLPDGRAVGAWGSKGMLSIGTFAPGATTPRAERFRADGRRLGAAPVGVDDRGDEVVAWQDDPSDARRYEPIRFAARPAGARRFGAVRTIGVYGDMLLDAVVGPGGDAAFLMAHGHTSYVVRRTRDGAVLPRIAIHGATLGDAGVYGQTTGHTLAVTASGAVLITTDDEAGSHVLQIAPDGAQASVADAPGCDADGVVVNRAGAGLMALRCDRTHAVQTFTVAAQATTARAHAARGRVIASGRNAAALSAYGGSLVFSRRDPATKRWSLMLWRAGHVHRLAVPSRAIPFDADAGPGPGGRPAAVYSACSKDPRYSGDWLKAAGCHIERIALTGNAKPVAVPGTGGAGRSDTTPSIWRNMVAFARHQDGGTRSTLYTSTRGAAPVARPMPKVACESDCDDVRILTTVQDVDLGAKSVVSVTEQDGGDTFGVGPMTTLQADPLNGARPKVLSTGFGDGACGYVFPREPVATSAPDGALWVAEGSTCDVPAADFGSYGPGRRARVAHPQGGVIVSAAFTATTTYWLRADRRILGDGDGIDSEACLTARARCAIVADPALPWRRVPKGQPIGPYPEDP